MPISRYQIRNVYSLADPELYKAADKDGPEALLEGVAMAGLVGVLRQLGDLAEFAAEIFRDLHEEVMATASRGHGLLVRVQQLESEFPLIERAFLSETRHSAFFPNPGIDWHPNRQTEQNLFTRGDLPQFVRGSYEECRGPPRLFLLDKFDVAGAGACLKRYTDPSFYKLETSSYETASAKTQRDKKIRKTKKKGSQWKGGETPELSQPSNKLHQLFLEERLQNGATEPERRVKLKIRPSKSPFDSENGKGYMEKLLDSPSEDKLIHEVPLRFSSLRLPLDDPNESRLEILDLGRESRSPCCSDSVENLSEKRAERWTSELPMDALHEEADDKHIAVNGEIRTDGYKSDDVASETDNYVDAIATMESELETDVEFRAKTDPSMNQEAYSDPKVEPLQAEPQVSDSQSVGNSTTAPDDGVESPLQAFACTEIPFRPRVSPIQVATTEKTLTTQHLDHKISNDTCIEVSEMPNLRSSIDVAVPVEEADLNNMSFDHCENLNSPRKTQVDADFLPTGDNLSPLSSVRDPEGEVDHEHPNDISSHQAEHAEDNYTTDSVDSSPHSDVKPSEATFHDDIPVAEETTVNPNAPSLPEEQLKEIDEKESNNSELEVVTGAVSVLADADRNGENYRSVFEDETELEERESESVHMETKDGNGADDVDRSEGKRPEDEIELERKSVTIDFENDVSMEEPEEVDQKTFISPKSNYVPCDSIPDSSLASCGDVDDSPSANSKILQDSIPEETDQNGPQAVVSCDLGSQPGNTDVQLLDIAPKSTLFTESDNFLESKYPNHDDPVEKSKAELSFSLEDKVDQPTELLREQSLLASRGSECDSPTHVDHETHCDTHSVNVASQLVAEEEDLQREPYSVPVLEIPQSSSQKVNLFDQVKPSPTPVFSVFGMLPQVNLEETPPVPPLPPMQWRMRKPQNALLTPKTDGSQHSSNHLPPIFPSRADEAPQVAGHPSLEENRNPSNLVGLAGPSVSPEAKFSDNFVPQPAVEIDHESHSVPTTSSLPSIDDERPNGTRPMKINRPRSPLIDSVAAHDKTKLRKVAERVAPKEEESDTLLEQIRAKSFNLKPAVQTRPSIHGPKTNLRVAAILEKANAIRQAFVGSDDDDDGSDSWSDS